MNWKALALMEAASFYCFRKMPLDSAQGNKQ